MMLPWQVNRVIKALEARVSELEHKMALSQNDLVALSAAAAAEDGVVTAIQQHTAAQADEITQLQSQLAGLAVDDPTVEAIITRLQNNNQTLANVANEAVGTPATPVNPVEPKPVTPAAEHTNTNTAEEAK